MYRERLEMRKGHVPRAIFLDVVTKVLEQPPSESPGVASHRVAQTNATKERGEIHAAWKEHIALYQTTRRLISDSVRRNEHEEGRTCFSLSEAIARIYVCAYLLLTTALATTPGFGCPCCNLQSSVFFLRVFETLHCRFKTEASEFSFFSLFSHFPLFPLFWPDFSAI